VIGGQDHSHPRSSLFRPHDEHGQRVTPMELFFDLVYVFAMTQISHVLLEHLSLHGTVQALMLLLAVWWAWVYTSWITNWLDPDRPLVRIMLIGVMLASLGMSVALPDAFGERGLMFALAYVAIQLGRTLFMVAVLETGHALRRNFVRVSVWFVASGALWLAGGLAEGSTREMLWLTALIVDYLAPARGFWTPGLGRSYTGEWTIHGGHLAERCQLLVIVALGESILVTGATTSRLPLSAPIVTAFVIAFLSSVAMWWIYFSRTAEAGIAIIARSRDPGRLGRSAYTYYHLPMVAGIIVAAVGDELTIAHPHDTGSLMTTAVILGGPALYLLGHSLYKRVVFGILPPSRIVALVVLLALIPAGLVLSNLAISVAAMLILWAVAGWEAWAYRALVHTPDPAASHGTI
jgi:low temperature requirement protein LtrA